MSPLTLWSRIDPTLWNIAFAGQAKASRCKYCFSLTHLAEDCDWAPTPSAKQAPWSYLQTAGFPNAPTGSRGPQARPRQVCMAWNYYPVCSFGPACKYEHSCTFCDGPHMYKAQHCRQRHPQHTPPTSQPPCWATSIGPNGHV